MLSTKRLALALWIFVPLQAANTSTTEPSRCSAETSETAFLQSQAHIDSLSDMMSTAKPKKIKVKNIIDKPDSWFVVYLHARLQQFDEAGNGDGCLTRDEYSNFDALVDVLQGPSLLQKEKLEKPWRRWRRRYYSHGSTSTTSTTSAPRADLEELCFNTTLSPSSLVTEGIVEDIQVFREFLEGYKTSLFAGMEDQYQFLVKARAELLEKILPRLSRDPLGLEYLGTDPLAEYASLNVSQAELEQEIIRVYDLLDFYDQRISELEEFLENPKSIVDDALKNYLPDQLGDDNMTEDTDDTNDPVTSFVGRGENKAKEAKPARPALVQSQRKSRILQHAFGQDSNSKQGPDGRCIYGRRDTCLFRIGDIPLLGTHNAGAYPRMRFRCPDQVQSCQEWNTVNLQACFDERDGICRTERFAVCEPQNRDNIFDCEAKYLCLDVLYDGAVCGTTQAGCYAGGAFRWSGCRLIPVAQGLVCAGGSVLRTIRQFRSCANAVISGPATCSALGPRANLLPQGVVSCLFENQGYNLIGQLNRGVRLFDLDTCLGWDPWWLILCHGTGTESAGGRQLGLVLFEIKAWLNQNRHEVVVIRWSDKGNQLPHLYPAERARFGDLDAYHDAAREWHVNRAFPRRTPQTDPTWTTDWTRAVDRVVDKLEQYCTWSNGGATRDRPVMLSAFSRIFSRVGWSRRDPEVLDCDANRQRGDIDCPDGWSSDRRTLSIDSIVNGLRGLASGEGICNDANARVVNFELANRLDGLLRTCSDNGVKVAAVLVDYVGMSNERIRQSINAMISRQVLFRDRERAQQPPNTQLPVEVVGAMGAAMPHSQIPRSSMLEAGVGAASIPVAARAFVAAALAGVERQMRIVVWVARRPVRPSKNWNAPALQPFTNGHGR
eukprot:Skav212087  [mRNA]  locus=scaffold4509:15701:18585:+ [translate_table: standard]